MVRGRIRKSVLVNFHHRAVHCQSSIMKRDDVFWDRMINSVAVDGDVQIQLEKLDSKNMILLTSLQCERSVDKA